MPSINEHLKLSLKRTGKNYKELHEWIEGVNATPKDHKERHDILKIPQFLPIIEERFEKEGTLEYLQRIKDDYEQTKILNLIRKLKKFKF